jgi:hypothetical protein
VLVVHWSKTFCRVKIASIARAQLDSWGAVTEGVCHVECQSAIEYKLDGSWIAVLGVFTTASAVDLIMHSSDDPSWSLYPNTILEFHTPSPFAIDLREALTSRERELLCANHLDQPFAVITACNPRGQRSSDLDNTRLAEQLEAQVRQRGLSILHVEGVSPDGNHRESGIALKVSRKDATALAKQSDQSAFFWFDGEYFWIMPALIQAEPLVLPSGST